MNQGMSRKTESFARIVVGLDASQTSLMSLEWAARLARGLELELSGLYVEDINLIHLAGFRFAREFALSLQSERPLSHDDMAARLRLQADQARQAVERLAGTTHLRCTFQVRRGDVGAVLLETAQGTDLVVVGAQGAGGLARRLGSCARRLLALARAPVLVVPARAVLTGPVVCLYDGSAGAERALSAAARLAMVDHKALDVVVLATPSDWAHVKSQAMALLNDYPELQVQLLVQPRADWHTIASLGARLVVLPADHPWVRDQSLERWIAQQRVPVLVTR